MKVILQTMGAQCIGRSPRNQRKQQHRNGPGSPHSNTTNDHTIQLPSLIIKYHQPSIYPLFSNFSLPSQWQLHRQFRYQDYFELTSLASNTKLQENASSEVKQSDRWGVCSDLNRQLWQFIGRPTMILNGGSYVLSDLKSQSMAMVKDEMGKFKFDFLPKSVLKLKVTQGKNIKVDMFSIKEEKELVGLLSKEMKERREFQHVKTDFLSGFFCCSQVKELEISNWRFLLELFGAESKSKDFTFFLYPNQVNKILNFEHSNQNIKIKPSTYWQVKMWMKQRGVSLWNVDLIQALNAIGFKVFQVYCAFQMLHCSLTKLQRQYLEGGLYLSQSKDFIQKKLKTINSFVVLEQTTMKQVVFLTRLLLMVHKYKDSSKFIEDMIISLAFDVSIVADGLFCEFGVQINEQQHPFRNDPYHFLKFKEKYPEKQIRIIKKQILPTDTLLACYLIESLQVLCSYGSQLSQEIIQGRNQEVLTLVQRHCTNAVKESQNGNLFGDYLLRISLLRFLLRLIGGYIDEVDWAKITQQFESYDLVAAETAFVYLVLASISQSIKRGTEESNEEEKKSYLKALQMGLKLFGDPRASRQGTEVKVEAVWLLYLIENYCAIYAHSAQKLEYNFLKNLKHCLKEDLKGRLKIESELEQQDYVYNFNTLIRELPFKKFTGWMIKRSEILDTDKEASRSNYSQYGSSSAIKRLNKSFYKVTEWEFGLKPEITEGVLLWGHSVPSPPQTVPTLKNCQVLAIASGNYHVVFITEDGVFGWGENQSGQLGKHNMQKVYKEAVLIQTLKINRKTDSFQLSCGNEHTALLMNGKLTMWGQEDCGITGGTGCFFDSIACGGLHTLGVRGGKVFSWGRGEGGQLGHPFTQLNQKKREETTVFFLDSPTQIKIDGVVKAACGDAHSIVLTSEGRVWVFGFSYQGQLGLGLTGESETFQVFEPTQLLSFQESVVDVWAGPTASFFKTSRGDVFSCGYNDCLQLGIDRVLKILQKKKYIHRVVDLNKKKLGEQEFSKPRKLDIFREEMGFRLIRLECGENHCLALAQYQNHEELLVGWGLNRHFQLDFKINEVTAPRTLDILHSVSIRQFCCGSTFSLAVVGSLSLTLREVFQTCYKLSKLAMGTQP